MHVIVNTIELESACTEWRREPFVTIDTEFIREKTYYPQLCLVQVAGESRAACIDPLAPGIDLSPLFALMADTNVLKVFHACRQDLEIFYEAMREMPAPVFDTQVAAMVLGFGESVSYETLAAKLAGATIDKSSRFTDWARRPLSEKQLTYALSDVTHLRTAYLKLKEKIDAKGRAEWIAEEMAEQVKPSHYANDPNLAWRRLRLRSRSPRQLAFLREVAKWRELEAQRHDIPRGRLVKDDTLVEIASSAPKTLAELQDVRGLGNHLSANKTHGIMAALDAARTLDPADYPEIPERKPLPPRREGLLDLLRTVLKITCDAEDVAQKLVADREDLEDMLLGKTDVPFLHGWRYEIFGQHAEALMQGRLAITHDLAAGRVVMREV